MSLTTNVILSFVKAVIKSNDSEVFTLQQLNHLVSKIETLSSLNRFLKLSDHVSLCNKQSDDEIDEDRLMWSSKGLTLEVISPYLPVQLD